MNIRDRIREFRTVKGRDLLPNPLNWRVHPPEQADAVRGLLTEVGQVDVLRAVETPEGLMLVDGHLRGQIAPDADWRVAVLDLTPNEMKLVLATFDPVAAMAEADKAKLEALLAEIEVGSAELAALLEELGEDCDGNPDADKGPALDLSPTFGVLIHVPDEESQRMLLRTADDSGFDATAILTGLIEPPKHEELLPPTPSGTTVIERSSMIKRSVRVQQIQGMFDLPKSTRSKRRWELKLDLPEQWNVGLIVGPSGSGKSTLAKEWFGAALVTGYDWPAEAAIVDGFPEAMSIAEVTALLSSVGFSSPPGWVKPFHVLSNGEQFRVTLARALAEQPALAVIDEFTSVVDRTVARVGSHAAQKAVRASDRRLVAVTCHYDVTDWLQPDWTLDMQTGEFARRSLQRRPELQVVVRRVGRDWWPTFRDHHYLSHSLARSVSCFLAEVEDRPAAFCAVIHQKGKAPSYRTHRLVTLPDFQGIGVGHALHEFVAGMFACRDKPYTLTSSHPAMIAHCARSKLWRFRDRGMNQPYRVEPGRTTTGSAGRMTTSFKYVGPKLLSEANQFSLLRHPPG
jgi:ABC-type lipoprotein export system ATPase subunit